MSAERLQLQQVRKAREYLQSYRVRLLALPYSKDVKAKTQWVLDSLLDCAKLLGIEDLQDKARYLYEAKRPVSWGLTVCWTMNADITRLDEILVEEEDRVFDEGGLRIELRERLTWLYTLTLRMCDGLHEESKALHASPRGAR